MRIHYPFDNSAISENYLENAVNLAKIDFIAAAAAQDDNYSICIKSWSSPEGNFYYNKALSAKRAKALNDLMVSRHPELRNRIRIAAGGEAWEDFRKALVSDRSIAESARKSMLEIVDSNDEPDVKESRLKEVDAYKAFYRKYFRRFRYAEVALLDPSGKPARLASDGSILSSRIAGKENHILFLVGSTSIEPAHAGNDAALKNIAAMLESTLPEQVESVVVIAGGSIDGSVAANERVARQRGAALQEWIENNYPQYKGKITLVSRGEDWAELRENVVSDNGLDAEAKSRILAIIDSNDSADAKEAKLRELDSWNYLQDNILPATRYATANIKLKAETDNTLAGLNENTNNNDNTNTATVPSGTHASAASAHTDSQAAVVVSRKENHILFPSESTSIEPAHAGNEAALKNIAAMLESTTPEQVESIVVIAGG
ncbi:MAG: hypothetical protein IJV01_07120, partial [Bacteroidales bacterium]|nr:hypothetical protein [Bacteroidales bacterium]